MANNLVFSSNPKKSHGIPKAEKALDRWIKEKQKHLHINNNRDKMVFAIVSNLAYENILVVFYLDETDLGFSIGNFTWLGTLGNYCKLPNWKKALEGQMSCFPYYVGIKPAKFNKKEKEFVLFVKKIISEIELPKNVILGANYSSETKQFNSALSGMLLPNNF